jgi:DDE superfamily endonuclease
VAAGHSVEVDPYRWQPCLDQLLGRIAGRFGRVEPRRRAKAFVVGLLADLPRKNCWTIAEHAGNPTPDGMQHLLARAVWDHDGVRDDVRGYLVDHFGEPDAVLVVDGTGDLKKGTTTVGIQRQDTGTAGRIENAQVAVYLVYAARAGHAIIDRELYVPRSWTGDRGRRQDAGIPEQVEFATKPALATQMIRRALDAGVPAGWVAGDEVYGADPALRAELEARAIGYVLAVACDHRVHLDAGGPSHRADALVGQGLAAGVVRQGRQGPPALRLGVHPPSPRSPRQRPGRAALAADPPPPAHQGAGLLPLLHASTHPAFDPGQGGRHQVDHRGAVPDRQGVVGLEQHQVRRWRSWYRWVTLAMVADAFLVVAAVTQRRGHPPPAGLVGVTCNEIQHLFAAMVAMPTGDVGNRLRWSGWRRRHQSRARTCHYQRQATQQP